MTHLYRGNYAEAHKYVKDSLTMYRAIHEEEDHLDIARALTNIGAILVRRTKYTEALEYYKKALKTLDDA